MRTGRVRNAWVKNCVALGLASGFIEPLEATAIFMSDLGARWLHHYLPTQDFEPELAAAYNRQIDRVFTRRCAISCSFTIISTIVRTPSIGERRATG